MSLATKVRLHEMAFVNLRDYLADAVADPRKARVVLEEAARGPLFERFASDEQRLLSELYSDVFARHAQLP
jgi:hypothetical protein